MVATKLSDLNVIFEILQNMFTGIVQGIANIQTIHTGNNFKTLTIKFPKNGLTNIQKGASIAINGTCLTVTHHDAENNLASFDVIQESLSVTNLGTLKANDNVNFERAAKFGDEIGGHLMSGHIHICTKIKRITRTEDNCSIYLETPDEFKRYLLPKGFAGLNGCSLTLGEVNDETFSVHLIPETLSMTTFGQCTEGELINLEVDSQTQSIVDTVTRVLKETKKI